MRCFFCKEYDELEILPARPPLSRKVYQDDNTLAVLELEQSVKGYTLVIPRKHHDTLFDEIPPEDLANFWQVVNKIGNAIKLVLGAENIYVASLCDGIKHFHVHLIPRYKWTDADKERYRELFTERDGPESISLCTHADLIGGFWYPADAERNYKNSDFWKLPNGERYKVLDDLAKQIKRGMICQEKSVK